MKPGLKRIEATLNQLGAQTSMATHCSIDHAPIDIGFSRLGSRSAMSSTQPAKTKPNSIEPFPLPKRPNGVLPTADVTTGVAPDQPQNQSQNQPQNQFRHQPANQRHQQPSTELTAHLASGASSASTQSMTMVLPALDPDTGHPTPEVTQALGAGSYRYAANPNLAIGLLKEVETLVRNWQAELEHIAQQIRAIYADGPIVDGWLESYASDVQLPAQAASVSMLRYAEIDHLMKLVEQICATQPAPISEDMRRTNYRLCGLDPDGNMWSRPCPSEQVPYVSLAIARYQKLRTLFTKKRSIENRLTSLVESLTRLHGQITDC